MQTTAIYVKTEEQTKTQAQEVAKDLGLSLSAIINGYLKQLIRTKTITFRVDDEIPNERTQALLKQSEEDIKKGNVSPKFTKMKDMISYLHEKTGE